MNKTGFKVTPEQLKSAITPKTKMLILCNPSNPTGSAYSKKELEALAEIVLKNNFYVLSDEIYEKLVYDDFQFVSFASLDPEIKKQTILGKWNFQNLCYDGMENRLHSRSGKYCECH